MLSKVADLKSLAVAHRAVQRFELSDERLSELNAEAAKIYPQLLRLAEELTPMRSPERIQRLTPLRTRFSP